MRYPLNNPFYKALSLCIIIIIGFSGCNSRPEGVLSQTEMEKVLTDIHLLEGTLRSKNMLFPDTNLYYYNSILAKHEITRAQFDSSLVWYTRHPKMFKNIYTGITENLNELEEEVKEGKYHPNYLEDLRATKVELWNKKTNYHFTKDSTRTQLEFEITNPDLLYRDKYVLRFYQRIAPADSSKNPYIVLRIHYMDNTTDSVYCISHPDSLLRRFTLSIPAKRPKQIRSLSGSILGSSKYQGSFDAKIDSISLKRIYNLEIQDSLKVLVNKTQHKLSKKLIMNN